MALLKAKHIFFVGIIIFFFGLFYDVLFAGIPPQDPPPYIAENFAYHSELASFIQKTGLGVVVLSIGFHLCVTLAQCLQNKD